MSKNVPYFVFVAVIAIASALMMFNAFFSIVSILDYTCFIFVLAVFFWLAWKAFGYLESKEQHLLAPLLALVAGVFVFHNLYIYAIGLSADGLTQVMIAMAAAAIVGILVIWLVARFASGGTMIFIAAIAGIAAIAYPAWLAAQQSAASQGVRQTQLDNAVVNPTYNPSKYVNSVEFKRKPDIYLLGQSAGTAESMLQNHLGMEGSPVNAFLQESGFRIFSNVFSEAQLTRPSYDLLLSMHRDLYFSLKRKDRGGMVSGNIPSPLFTLFRENGYEVNVLAEAAKFGIKGPFIDRYEIAIPRSVCNFHFVAEEIKGTMFLGACLVRKIFNPLLKPDVDSIFDFYMEKLDDIHQSEAPRVVYMHLRPPFHYRGDKMDAPDADKTAEFKQRSNSFLVKAAENLGRITAKIRESGRESIILVFGDHGLALSPEPEDGKISPFYIKDRYSVIGAMHPANACAGHLKPEGSYEYITTAQLMRSLVMCLSDGSDPYPPGYVHKGIHKQSTFAFDAYRYE